MDLGTANSEIDDFMNTEERKSLEGIIDKEFDIAEQQTAGQGQISGGQPDPLADEDDIEPKNLLDSFLGS